MESGLTLVSAGTLLKQLTKMYLGEKNGLTPLSHTADIPEIGDRGTMVQNNHL